MIRMIRHVYSNLSTPSTLSTHACTKALIMNPVVSALLTFCICYVIGSFPTAYLIGRVNSINIFEVGSGNMGAANVIRALGFRWGAIVWLLDMCKGIVAVLLGAAMPGYAITGMVIGAVAVVVGHNWSVIATLITGTVRGGKGAATAAGTWLILMAPWPGILIVTLLVWGAIVVFTRYVSLGVLVSVALGTLWVIGLMVFGDAGFPAIYLLYILGVGSMIFYRHRENIVRLLQGSERKLGERA